MLPLALGEIHCAPFAGDAHTEGGVDEIYADVLDVHAAPAGWATSVQWESAALGVPDCGVVPE